MRILFIFPRFHTNQMGLIQKLKEEGNVVKFISIGKGAIENYEEITPVIIGLSSIGQFLDKLRNPNNDVAKRNVKGIPKIKKLYSEVVKFKPDVLIIRSLNSTYFKIIIPIILFNGIRILSYTQNPKYVKNISFSKKIKHKIVDKFLKIKFFTSVMYRPEDGSLENLMDNKYLTFIPFFMFPSEKRKIKSEDHFVKFLSIGKFIDWKNHEMVIKAFSRIMSGYSFKLTIIGECSKKEHEEYYEKLKANIKGYNLANSIELIKNVPNKQIEDYYLSNDVFILFSLKEAAGISIVEAMTYGLPVICNVSNGSAHYVRNGYNGYVLPVNVEVLTKSIMYFIKNKSKVSIMGENSLELINNEFDINDSYNKFMKLISVI